jgi:signal transduction histidine kinase
MRRRDSYGRWAILAGLGLALALLFVHELIARRLYDASLHSLSTITTDTVPTVLHLSELRRSVEVIYRDVVLAGPEFLDQRDDLKRRLGYPWPTIDAQLAAYLALPYLVDEGPLRAELSSDLEAIRATEERLLAARTEDEAREVVENELVPLVRDVLGAIDVIMSLNAQEAGDATRAIVRGHERADAFSRDLLLLLGAVLAGAGALGFALVSRTEREMRERLEELDAFAGRVAHDLKSPLHPALLAASVLRNDPDLQPQRARELAERLDRNLRRAAGLVDGLLAYARAGAPFEPGARASLLDVVLELEPGLRHLCRDGQVELALAVPPRLEVAAAPTVVASIVDNLARNAILHMGEGEPRQVRIEARALDDGAVELEVTDTGPGIPGDLLRRLFRPFERGTDRPGGSGLGLATVKRLVERHGGEVTVSSHVGVGSTFRVRLPRARPPA